MNNKQTLTFNFLLSCFLLTLFVIFKIIPKQEHSKTAVAIVGDKMVFDEDIASYIYSNFGKNIAVDKISRPQLKDIVKNYIIDYKLLKTSKDQKLDQNPILKNQISKANTEITVKFVLENIANELVTEEKIQNEYDLIKNDYLYGNKVKHEYRVKHILVDSKTQALNIRKDLDEIFFENAAQIYSLDKASAKNGGDLGFFVEGTMFQEFEDNIKELKVGEVSQPFQTDFGWHLAKLENKKVIPAPQLIELKDSISKDLKDEAVADYINNISENINIKIIESK
ncbi:MAG: peptidylprolyl isomerase [Rickettsiales bacterium]|nr:peptidylprolyl isomerase [Rickettsiales bacterium]